MSHSAQPLSKSPAQPADRASRTSSGSSCANCGSTGTARVTLDGRASSDLDGDLTDVLWYDETRYLGRGMTLAATLGIGTHRITAEAIDATHKWSYAGTSVQVLPR